MSMTALSAHDKLDDALHAFVSVGHNAALGFQVRGHGPGWIEFAMPFRETTAGTGGETADPCAIYSLLDSACAMTPWAKLGYFSPYPTLDLRVDYLREPTPGATIIARGECYEITEDYSFTRGIAHEGDPDRPIATCTGTFMSFKVKA